MKILHWMKKETSGLAFATLELAKYEEKQGHIASIRQPQSDEPMYGRGESDIHCIHSQINPLTYHDNKPKFLWCHGEPISSVGNGVSMKAILDMAPLCEAFICMREQEHIVWNSIKRTYRVPKGIDLEQFHKLPGITERLSGEPAVLYIENWRGQRNPLYPCLAMQEVYKKYPKARLHLYNCNDPKMKDAFSALIQHNHWGQFVRSLQGPVQDVNLLLNRVDMVISGLFPLYARGIEAFGAGKGYIGAGYKENNYEFQCDFQPESMADAVVRMWENYDKVDFRKYAEKYHDVAETVRQSVAIYEKYL